jgi:hypothetical protein
MLVGDSWVLTFDQGQGTGGVWVDTCAPSDSQCLDGQSDHEMRDFRFYPAQMPGGVSVLGQTGPSVLILHTGDGGQTTFDVTTGQYGARS